MGKSKRFRLLLWKNLVLARRHPVATAFQLILPVVLAMVLVIVRQEADTIIYNSQVDYPRFGLGSCKLQPISPNASVMLAAARERKNGIAQDYEGLRISYAPANNITDTIMVTTASLFLQRIKIQGFSSEEELEDFFGSNQSQPMDVGGVVFVNMKSIGDLAKNVTYKLRIPLKKKTSLFKAPDSWLTSLTYPVIQMPGPRSVSDVTGGPPGYCEKGFLTIQHAVALGMAKVLSSGGADLKSVGVTLQRFPYPPYYSDYLLLALQQFLPLVLMISLLYPAFDLVKSLVYEKEKKLKESMKMMGLSGFLHWSSWFTKSLIFFGIDAILISFLLCCSFGRMGVLAKSDGTVVFVFILLYVISGICFCFMLSTFFSKANSAATAGGLIWFGTWIPYLFLGSRYATMTLSQKVLASLLCNMAMSFGGMQLYLSEGAGYGVQWNLLATPVTPDDNFTMASVFGMLILDSFIYLLISWYVDSVFPGEYGMPQKWYFPFQRSYWCGGRTAAQDSLPSNHQQAHQEFYEPDPSGLTAGIQIHGLTKVFNKTKVAVNNLNLNMYENQITVLLGHNGAGKTTTMSMLTGLFPPSQGMAYINGYNVLTDIDRVRTSLGLCPQHNVVFDDLTVEEHLYFACELKDCPKSTVQPQIDEMLRATNLLDKRKSLSSQLSGGMKRRLCVGMALVGGSKVVMLDEPTSGMDPTARRFTWDLLQAQTKGRTILLSTHFMDEADILGDRIAIMATGQLQCCGTPMFLKKKYGAGYHMIIVKKPGCDVSTIKTLVTSIISKAELESNVGSELSFILPHSSSNRFPHLFSQIEERKDQLKIASYGASVTTMEEVFLRVGEQSDETLKKYLKAGTPVGSYERLADADGAQSKSAHSNGNENEEFIATLDRNLTNGQSQGCSLFSQQFRAMLVKRMLHTKRNWLLILAQLIAPVGIVAVCLAIMQANPPVLQAPALNLNLMPFGGTIVPYSSSGADAAEMARLFAAQFQGSKDEARNMSTVTSAADLAAYLLKVAENNTFEYTRRYVVAASFYHLNDALEANLLFNGQPYHSPAIALAALDTAVVRYLTGNNDLRINVVNAPLPDSPQDQLQSYLEGYSTSFQISFNVMFGISFLVSSFVIFLVKERASDAKHLQIVSGVRPVLFWTATLLWDFVNYIVPCMFIMLVFVIFQFDGYNTGMVQSCLLLVFVVYGWCVLPFMYLMSFMFKVASSAYARMTMFNIFSGVVALIVVTMLMYINDNLREVSKTLDWVFMVLPNYCIAAALKDLYLNFYNMRLCEEHPEIASHCNCEDVLCYKYSKNYLAWKAPGIGRELLFMTAWGIVFFLLILLLEMGLGRRFSSAVFSLMWSRRNLDSEVSNSETANAEREDDDVVAEQKRVAATPMLELIANDNLILNNLSKYYGLWHPFRAVNHISVGVPRGECFGLLGINGAGKTTTFKMLTGDEYISEGDALVEGFSIRKDMRKVQQRLGYCPQFDAIIDEMTGRETLFMFSRLRGILERDIPDLVINLSKSLMFEEHIDKLVKNYSGGNKRKLSTAVALIGNPPMVLLDEPTTGMDPLARRMVWDTITRVRDSGCSIILTSHSMEECDVLCTRLAIMVNGRFKCLGSPQYLKNKFGNGYTLTAKMQVTSGMSPAEVDALVNRFKEFVKQKFPGSSLKDQHQTVVYYHIPQATMSWANLFSCLEKAKLQYHLEDYSVGQTTLEQVFLNFTKLQIDTDNS